MPLDGGGIARVQEFRCAAPGKASIRVFRPETDGGILPQAETFVFVADPVFLEAENPGESSPRPAFECDGSVARAQVRLPLGTSYYGGGEQAGPLERSGRSGVYWNVDAWRYGEETPNLYQSHPFVLAILPDGEAVGVLAHSIRKGGLVVAEDGIEFHFEAGVFDVYVIRGPHPLDVQRALASLVGKIELPPLWALGYHQSRWSYMDEAEVEGLAGEFKKRRIPCDALWLDIDHMDRFRTFSFDPRRFPEPKKMLQRLRDRGFHVVVIADPAVQAAEGHALAEDGLALDHFVKDALGRPWRGRCWPGVCYWPDFTREETRAWWAGWTAEFVRLGVDGIWNDMNEPAVFRTPTRTMPEDLVHRGFGGGSHARFHNVYGFLMTEATRRGFAHARQDRRPFVLTRSSFLGGARYAATWTGDNQARWEDLSWTIPMVLSLGVVGQPFAGPDVGGYDGDPSPELFVRWFEIAAYLPFCRGHSEKGACRKEPWALGEEAERHVRAALERRMRLLPYLYTLFRESSESGVPIVRPLAWADPADHALRRIEDAFLLGDALLVAPAVERSVRERVLRLPRGRWFDFETGAILEGGREVRIAAPLGRTPVFARAGSIVVLGPARLNSYDPPSGPHEIRVFADEDGRATGRWYEDSGDGFAYLGGAFCDRRLELRVEGDAAAAGRAALRSTSAGSLFPADRPVSVTVHGLGGDGRVLTYTGADRAEIALR